jgi:putative nucleotidyltransferase with HDIG domain
MISRPTALALMEEKIENKNLRKHILAVEAGMTKLASVFGEDENLWGLTGLLHDLDYAVTLDKPDKHTFITEEWLEEFDLPDWMIYAIRCHPGHAPCRSRLDWSLYAVDPATGFIVACALMHPSKKLANIDGKNWPILMRNSCFAASGKSVSPPAPHARRWPPVPILILNWAVSYRWCGTAC